MIKKVLDRRDYPNNERLKYKNLPTSPWEMFDQWIQKARKHKILDYNAMTLATTDAKGIPNIRVVLLKEYSEDRGLIFFTNYHSEKGKEIEEHPKIAINFYWPSINKQIRIKGIVEKTDTHFSDQYFTSRPLGSQISANISKQSQKIEKRYQLIGDFAQKLLFYREKKT